MLDPSSASSVPLPGEKRFSTRKQRMAPRMRVVAWQFLPATLNGRAIGAFQRVLDDRCARGNEMTKPHAFGVPSAVDTSPSCNSTISRPATAWA